MLFLTAKEAYLLDDKHSGAVTQWCFERKVFSEFYQNSLVKNCIRVLKIAGLRPATLLKKRIRLSCFSANFAKFLRSFFLQNTSSGCFWNILYTCPNYEAQINLEFFLSEKKIKESSNNNQIYSFFETHFCWTWIFDYF